MPEIIESVTTNRGAKAKYEWDAWFDGKSRRFTKSEDFPTAKAESFLSMARGEASKRGLYIHGSVKGEDAVEFETRTEPITNRTTSDPGDVVESPEA